MAKKQTANVVEGMLTLTERLNVARAALKEKQRQEIQAEEARIVNAAFKDIEGSLDAAISKTKDNALKSLWTDYKEAAQVLQGSKPKVEAKERQRASKEDLKAWGSEAVKVLEAHKARGGVGQTSEQIRSALSDKGIDIGSRNIRSLIESQTDAKVETVGEVKRGPGVKYRLK